MLFFEDPPEMPRFERKLSIRDENWAISEAVFLLTLHSHKSENKIHFLTQ